MSVKRASKTTMRVIRGVAVAGLAGGLGVGGAVALMGEAPAGASSPAVPLPAPVVAAADVVVNPTLELFNNTLTCAVYLTADGVLYEEFGLGPVPQIAGRPACIAE